MIINWIDKLLGSPKFFSIHFTELNVEFLESEGMAEKKLQKSECAPIPTLIEFCLVLGVNTTPT